MITSPNILIYKDDRDIFSQIIYRHLVNHDLFFNYNICSKETIQILPDLVICIGRDFSSFSKIYHYFAGKIPCLFIDINIFPIDLPTFFTTKPNYVICSNQQIKNKYINSAFKPESLFVCGNILFDLVKTIDKRYNKNIQFKVFCDINWDLKLELLKKQTTVLVDIINTYPNYTIELRSNKKITYKHFSKCSNFAQLRIIKEAFTSKRICLLNGDGIVLDSIAVADYCIIPKNELLIYATLMSKPILLVSEDQEDFDIYGHSLITDLIEFSSLKHNLTEEQLNYYLVKYLPGVFDADNMKRFDIVVKFLVSIDTNQKQYSETLLNKFINCYPQLIDPFHFLKLDMQEEVIKGIRKLI